MPYSSKSISGAYFAQRLAFYARQDGVDVFVGTATTPTRMMQRPLSADDNGFVPLDGGNASIADPRLFDVSPLDLPVRPVVGSEITWRGQLYTVIYTSSEELAGVPAIWHLYVYRSPQADTATAAPTGETRPGVRKTYYPPPQA